MIEGEVRLLGLDPFVNRKKLMGQIGVLFGQRSNLVKDSFKLLKAIYSISDEQYKKTD